MSDKLVQDLLMGILAPGDIAVPAQKIRLGKGTMGFLFHPLHANAEKFDPLATAPRAKVRGRSARIALMADQVLARRVVG